MQAVFFLFFRRTTLTTWLHNFHWREEKKKKPWQPKYFSLTSLTTGSFATRLKRGNARKTGSRRRTEKVSEQTDQWLREKWMDESHRVPRKRDLGRHRREVCFTQSRGLKIQIMSQTGWWLKHLLSPPKANEGLAVSVSSNTSQWNRFHLVQRTQIQPSKCLLASKYNSE